MNWYFIAAGLLAAVIGLAHSVLGEVLVFRRMRLAGFIPTNGAPLLHEAHVRILWASWHLVTIMGFSVSTILFWLALPASARLAQSLAAYAALGAMLGSSALVLVGTRGKHPGWAGLLVVAGLTAVGMYG